MLRRSPCGSAWMTSTALWQEEKIYHMAGARRLRRLSTYHSRLIRAAGREPVERDPSTTSSPPEEETGLETPNPPLCHNRDKR